jgi:hypothetical protein
MIIITRTLIFKIGVITMTTILEHDLKTIKTVLMQGRGGYHITKTDYIEFLEALKRINTESKDIKQTEL